MRSRREARCVVKPDVSPQGLAAVTRESGNAQDNTTSGIVLSITIRSDLWEVALDQYGYVTSSDAARLGLPKVELTKLAHRGKLRRIFQGVYRFRRDRPLVPRGVS